MAYTPIDLFRDVLPKTNCGDCGWPTCLAFAFAVVQEKKPLDLCPHIDGKVRAKASEELDSQHRQGRYLRQDLARDALEWARKRATSVDPNSVAERLDGRVVTHNGQKLVELPFFGETVMIGRDSLEAASGAELDVWEKVLLYNHVAQGGSSPPKGDWIGIEQIPNSAAKSKTVREEVERRIAETFSGKKDLLLERAAACTARQVPVEDSGADLAVVFRPLPRVPVKLLFWDSEPEDGIEARVKLLFDSTVPEHLDLESLVFLCENLRDRLCGKGS